MVLSSEYEPFGVVVNEASCCGCAVAASDRVGAAGDLIAPIDSDLIYPCGDVGALSLLLRKLCSDRHVFVIWVVRQEVIWPVGLRKTLRQQRPWLWLPPSVTGENDNPIPVSCKRMSRRYDTSMCSFRSSVRRLFILFGIGECCFHVDRIRTYPEGPLVSL